MREHSLADAPRISVVVAAYNADDTLSRCIDSILAQSHEPAELLIVDDGSTDHTAEVLGRHPKSERFTAIRVENGGPSRARNLGVRQTKGEWIAFFDADCYLHPHCLRELQAAAIRDGSVASVGGMQCSPEDDSLFGRAVQQYFESIGFMTGYIQKRKSSAPVETPHNPSCNVLYRRSAFEEAGGFDEKLWPGEDCDLDHRVTIKGHRHLFQRRAVVYHHRPSSAAAFGRMMTSYGRVQMLLVRRYGFIRKLHYLPLVVALAPLALAAGLWLWPKGTVVAVAVAAIWTFFFLERLRGQARLGVIFYRLFLLNAWCWLAGFFAELVRPGYDRAPSLPSW